MSTFLCLERLELEKSSNHLQLFSLLKRLSYNPSPDSMSSSFFVIIHFFFIFYMEVIMQRFYTKCRPDAFTCSSYQRTRSGF